MDLIEERKNIQIEETKFKAALAQSLFSRLGAAINFINKRHDYQHDWHLNGKYNIVAAPQFKIDGVITYPHNFTITDMMLMVGSVNAGTSGITEIDIKWRPENTGAFSSIFTTTPKFTYLAAADSSIRVGQIVAQMTAPVLFKTTFNAYDQLRLDVIQQISGNVEGVFAKLFIRPR